MLIKKPVSVRTFEALNRRFSLSKSQQYRFQHSQRGFQGELELATLLNQQPFHHLMIYDSEFEETLCPQLDFIVITSSAVLLYDAKHYRGDYTLSPDGFLSPSGKKVHSPLTQLNRAYDVLDILLKKVGCQLPIVKKLVFTHPNFMLYGHEPGLPIVMRSQLDQHFRDVSHRSGPLTSYHEELAEYIKRQKVEKQSYDLEISYSYEELDKGVWCGCCLKEKMVVKHKHVYCPSCQMYEPKSVAVKRSLAELGLLCPDMLMTSVKLRDWCGGEIGLGVCRAVVDEYRLGNE